MDKEQLIRELNQMVASGELSRDEVIRGLGMSQCISTENSEKQEGHKFNFSLTKTLYVIGASIVVIGVVIFVAQIWGDMSAFGQIVITLGLGLMFAALGSLLMIQKPETYLGPVFHVIGGLLIPGGILVTLDTLNMVSDWSVTNSFICIFAFYLILNFVHKHAVLTLFAIASGTVAVYLFALSALDPVLNRQDTDIMLQYLTMMMGASYFLLARAFRQNWNQKLIGALHFFGVTGFLGAAFIRALDSGFWELLYFLIVFGGLFLSVYLKSRIVLVMSTIFLIIHVSYITSEYFANSLGWPLALVILGLIFIGLGYASITINNKYIKGEDQAD